jgi:hypothetical protein
MGRDLDGLCLIGIGRIRVAMSSRPLQRISFHASTGLADGRVLGVMSDAEPL